MTERLWSDETGLRTEPGRDDTGRARADDAEPTLRRRDEVDDGERGDEVRPAGETERQLTLLEGGGRRPEWWLSTRTRVVGKRGVADARAVLLRTSRGRPADFDLDDAERRAG
jgi:hypothetical protein